MTGIASRRFSLLAATVFAVTTLCAGCPDANLDDERGEAVRLTVGVLVCAPTATSTEAPRIFAYAVGPGGGIDSLVGTFNNGTDVGCADIVQADDGTVYVANQDVGAPYSPPGIAFDPDGSFAFNFAAAPEVEAPAGIAVVGESVVIGDAFGGLYHFDLQGRFLGELVPGFDAGAVTAVVASASGAILAGGLAGLMRFVQSSSAPGTWVFDGMLDAPIGTNTGLTPLPGGGYLVLSSGGEVVAYDASGSFVDVFTNSPLGPSSAVLALERGNVLVSRFGDDADPTDVGGIVELAPDGTVQRLLPQPANLDPTDVWALGLVREAFAHAPANFAE